MSGPQAGLAIAQLTREPVMGAVKTRMQPQLSSAQALSLHQAMTRYMTRRLAAAAPLTLWVDGDPQHSMFTECLSLGAAEIATQPAGDLGERMAFIARRTLANHDKAVLVGSDAPSLGPEHIAATSAALDRADVTLIPAYDGGYVLMGLRVFCPEIFVGITWGTDSVLEQSLAALMRYERRVEVQAAVPDIDRSEDLRWLPEDLTW
ncbi:MAG: TIGR04282 family arsenosugar biosynthesis glycosyltransferase [Pseudomonadota bacterium]